MNHADLLAEIPMFGGLTDADREELAARMSERKFAVGATVFAKGDAGASLYVVLSGAVEIFLPGNDGAGDRVVLKDVCTGGYFGELALLDSKPRSASVVVTVDTVLLELTREEFGAHLARSQTAALAILSEMADHLRETNAMLSQRAATNAVREIEEHLTWSQRLADKVAELNGSWTFILFLISLTVVWTFINVPPVAMALGLAFKGDDGKLAGFDPFPFILYNLVLAILVALQGPLIVMSQNRQSLKDRAQAETDFRVNLKNEVGIETLVRELAAFRAETGKRLDVLERAARADKLRQDVPMKRPGGPLEPGTRAQGQGNGG
jgi:uncharacterized membrane protein